MLGWLAAAAAPILIHLWSRRRYREMSWAAMEYLLAAARRQTRPAALRAMAAAGAPHVAGGAGGAGRGRAVPRARRTGLRAPADTPIACWCSTARIRWPIEPTDKTRFERAKELARQIVEESPQGDAFTLVLMSSPPRVVVGTAGPRARRNRPRDRQPPAAADHGRPAGHGRRGPAGGRQRPARQSPAGPARGLLPHRLAAR